MTDNPEQTPPETTNTQAPQETQSVAHQKETVETPQVPSHYFLLEPSNEVIVSGENRDLPPLDVKWVFIVGVPLLLVAVALVVYAVMRWLVIIPAVTAGSASPPNTLLNGVLWTVAAAVVSLFVIGWLLSGLGMTSRRRALQKQGQLVWGELLTAVGKKERSGDLSVTLEYQFEQPNRRRKRTLTGKARETRNDLKDKALPTPGTPIAVLYLNEKNYEVL